MFNRMMYLAIFVGGALGSLVRELVSPLIPVMGLMTSSFAANIVACFIIGWLYAVRHKVHAHVQHLGAIGYSGGLSTFSAFTADLFEMATTGRIGTAFSAAGLEILFGILAAVAGEVVGRKFHRITQP